MWDRSATPNLASIARGSAARHPFKRPVDGANRIKHGRVCFVARLLANLSLGRPDDGIALQQGMSQVRPPDTLTNQSHFGGRFDHHLVFDEGTSIAYRDVTNLGKLWPSITENPRITIVV